jgi:hypothetical protein
MLTASCVFLSALMALLLVNPSEGHLTSWKNGNQMVDVGGNRTLLMSLLVK